MMWAAAASRWAVNRVGVAFLLALPAIALTSCSGLPVQEVSDARQAIGAARAAGSDHYTPATLQAAEVLVAQALDGLSEGDYRTAKQAARAAKKRATLAREVALSVQALQ